MLETQVEIIGHFFLFQSSNLPGYVIMSDEHSQSLLHLDRSVVPRRVRVIQGATSRVAVDVWCRPKTESQDCGKTDPSLEMIGRLDYNILEL